MYVLIPNTIVNVFKCECKYYVCIHTDTHKFLMEHDNPIIQQFPYISDTIHVYMYM